MLRRVIRNRNRKGQSLVEYALIIAGVALVGTVGISMFGHKVADLIGTVAAILPGAHTDDNAPIVAGHLIETDNNGPGGSIEISPADITADNGMNRINGNLLGNGGGVDSPLVQESGGTASGE
jgi:hypothetical protein